MIISIIKEFQNKSTGRVNFLQANDPYSIVERLEKKPDLSPYANLITLTSFQGSLSRGITLDYPFTFLMISDIAQANSLYLTGHNTGYNNAKQVSNSIVQAYARSLRLFKEYAGGLSNNHPFKRSSNLRVLGWLSHLNEKYSSAALKDSILRDLSEGSLDENTTFAYNRSKLIEEGVLKKNYMLDIIDGPDLTGSTEVELNKTQSESTFGEDEGENKTDILLNSIRRYFYANTLQSALFAYKTAILEKEFGNKSGTKKSTFTSEEEKTYDDPGTTRENQLVKSHLSTDLKTQLKRLLKKELTQLATLPVEVEVSIKWFSGKGKFDKLRNSKTIVEKVISGGDKSIVVSMSRLLSLPVYSEIKRNKVYRDFLYEGKMTGSEFDQLIKNIKKYCSEYIENLLVTML